MSERTTRRALSVSQYETLASCPYRWYQVHLLKKPVPKADYLEFGAIAHAVIQAYVEQLVGLGEPYAPHLLDDVFRDFIRHRVSEPPVPPQMLDRELDLVRKFVARFRLDLQRLWKPEAALAITYEGEPCDWWDDRAFLRGKLDLTYVDGFWAECLDWKTSWAPYPNDEGAQRSLQAKTYAMVLYRHNPALVELRVMFDFIRFGGVQRRASFGPRDCDETLAFWRATSDALEERLASKETKWNPRPGPHCTGCPIIMRCPLQVGGHLDGVAIRIASEAEDAARRILFHEASIEAERARVKLWVQTHGRVTVDDVSFDLYHDEEAKSYPAAPLAGLADRHFIDKYKFLRVDASALKKLRASNPAFWREADALGTPTGRVTFTHRKAGEEAKQ